MGVAENLKTLRRVYGLTQKELAEIAGVSDKAVWTWENETVPPKVGYLVRLSAHFALPVSALIEDGGVFALDPETRKYQPRPTQATAPLYAAIAAGRPIEEIEIAGEVPVPEHVLQEHPRGFFLKVSGKSMDRVLPDGSYAFVDPDAEVSNGDVAALMVNGHDATIKRFHRMASSMVLQPDSCDPAFTDTIFDYSKPDVDTITLIGRVVWFVAPYGDRL